MSQKPSNNIFSGNTSSATASPAASNGQSSNKKAPAFGLGWPMILGIAGFILILGFLIYRNVAPQKAAVAKANKTEYETTSDVKVHRDESQQVYGQNAAGQQANANFGNSTYPVGGANAGLTYVSDPTTGQNLVVTPSGNFNVSSPEGQAYISQYNQMNASGVALPNQPAIAPQNTAILMQQQQARIDSLQQQVSQQNAQITQMRSLMDRQQQTIINLSNLVQSVRPSSTKRKSRVDTLAIGYPLPEKSGLHTLATVPGRAWIQDGKKVVDVTVNQKVDDYAVRAIDTSNSRVLVQKF